MNLFIKKTSGDSLHSLNEEEIQKKLYGTFHKNTLSQNLSLKPSPSKSVPFIRPKVAEKPASDLVPQFKLLAQKSVKTIQSFPWKFSIVTMGLVFLSIYSFQFISGAFQDFSKARTFQQVTTQNTKALEETVKSDPETSVIQNQKSVVSPKKTFYAVQICTYQKESDAKSLARILKDLNFSSFYLRMYGSQNKIPYYVVFIGKNESYAAANEKLKEFRKSDQYQKFPDAFISSI